MYTYCLIGSNVEFIGVRTDQFQCAQKSCGKCRALEVWPTYQSHYTSYNKNLSSQQNYILYDIFYDLGEVAPWPY